MGNSASQNNNGQDDTQLDPSYAQAQLISRVDGGGVLPTGLYAASDYDLRVIRKLIVERKLAPFYQGLGDLPTFSPSIPVAMTSNEPAEAAEGVSGDQHTHTESSDANSDEVPDTKPSLSATSGDTALHIAGHPAPSSPTTAVSAVNANVHAMLSTPSPQRTSRNWLSRRLQRLSLSSLALGGSSSVPADIHTMRTSPVREHPPKDGLDKLLYIDGIECPICFLYYPKNINYSRCCYQPICTECFIQIKRSAEGEPSACPYCLEAPYGVTYNPQQQQQDQQGLTRSISDVTTMQSKAHQRLRRSLGVSAPGVVSSDMIRPQLAAQIARRQQIAQHRDQSDALRLNRRYPGVQREFVRTFANPRMQIDRDYYHALRDFTQELEDAMVMEAIRLSMLEQAAPVDERDDDDVPLASLAATANVSPAAVSPVSDAGEADTAEEEREEREDQDEERDVVSG